MNSFLRPEWIGRSGQESQLLWQWFSSNDPNVTSERWTTTPYEQWLLQQEQLPQFQT